MSNTQPPSPYATHADLSALRREIQLDVRAEMRDFTTEIRSQIKNMQDKAASNRQWIVTTLVTVANLFTTMYVVMR